MPGGLPGRGMLAAGIDLHITSADISNNLLFQYLNLFARVQIEESNFTLSEFLRYFEIFRKHMVIFRERY